MKFLSKVFHLESGRHWDRRTYVSKVWMDGQTGVTLNALAIVMAGA